jgi:outer membrane protein OmpA-like peptidoglycan-associated protein
MGFPLLCGLALGFSFVSTSASAESWPPQSELWVYGGIQGGVSDLSGTSLTESAKGGWNLGFKLIASKYTPDWVLDLGVGWFHDQQSASSSNGSIKVITNAGFLDICPRYRLTDHWQIGPSIPIFFGPDVSFSEAASGSSMSLFGGVRVEYELPVGDSLVTRFGAQAVTDITISNRQVSWFQVDFQIGLPTKGKETPAPAPAPAPEPVAEPAVNLPVPPLEAPQENTIFPAKVIAPAEVAITLNDVYFHFDTNSAKVSKLSVERLKKLSHYLLKNNDAWAKIHVDGHTDRRGTLAHNTVLSKKRAQSVERELIKGGVEKSKIKATGYGPTRPVDPAKNHVAYAKNRRVEVILEGVTDTARLAKEINALSKD